MADQIDKKAFGFMTTAAEGTWVDIDPTILKGKRMFPVFSSQEDLEKTSFTSFLKKAGIGFKTKKGQALHKLWLKGGSPLIYNKDPEELLTYSSGKKGRAYMEYGKDGAPDSLSIKKGDVGDFIAELAHSYDYLDRTPAARDSLSRAGSRARKLFGKDVYGMEFEKGDWYYPKGPGKTGPIEAFWRYQESITDPKTLPSEFRTHRVIEKNLWNMYDKGIGG
jgi:hypothetical protein